MKFSTGGTMGWKAGREEGGVGSGFKAHLSARTR